MYNLDQFTHKQIKIWGYTSINCGKNVFNPYNSVTKFFFSSFVLKIYIWGSPVCTHTFHRCVSAMNNKMN